MEGAADRIEFDGRSETLRFVGNGAVRRLRAKLDDPFTPKLLHTVRGMGYVLEVRQP